MSPSYLEVQLGSAFAGTEFQFRTDTGIYPGTIQVGEDGVLRLEIGGSSQYILSCVSTGTATTGYIPQPEITSPPINYPYVSQSPPATQFEQIIQHDPGIQVEPVAQVESTPLPVLQAPEESVSELTSYEQPAAEVIYYVEEDDLPGIPTEYLIILIVGLLVCIAVLVGLKLASPKSSDDDGFDDYGE